MEKNKNNKILIFSLILITLSNTANADTYINEIMYNPEGSDNNQEFIEIYSNDFQTIINFSIKDSSSEDCLELLKEGNNNYHLIVEEGFNYTNINSSVYSVGATIGNQLGNNGDMILILNNNTIIDATHYYPEWGADGNNRSLCLIQNRWIECIQSPGRNNSIQTIMNIRINEFLPNPEGNDTASMPGGEWIEIYNLGEAIDLTGTKLKDKFGRTITITNTNTYNTIIEKNGYLVVYTNGLFGFLNNEGLEEITLIDKNDNQLNKISYDSSEEGNSWSLINNSWKITKPSPGKENPDDSEQNKYSKIEIKKIYLGSDNKSEFGDNIRVKVKIYKGNSSKRTINAYAKSEEKISKTTKINLNSKYREYELTVPIQLYPNCNKKYENGTYSMIFEGLDNKTEKEFKVEGISNELCEVIKEGYSEEEIVSFMEEDNEVETIINSEQNTTNNIIYESTSKKSSNMAIYFFCFILILVIIQLGLENGKNKD